nr:fimbrial protein [Collimonas antrihumi]
MAASAFASTSAFAADGTIDFTGAITAVTCSISGGTPGSGTGDFNVTLPTVQASAFTANPAAGSTGYNIYIGAAGEAGCVNGTLAAVHYEASSPMVDRATGRLNLLPASTAAGVQVRILDALAGNAPINLFTNVESTPVTVVGNQATLPFIAEYYAATPAAVTPGSVLSNVNYSVTFN